MVSPCGAIQSCRASLPAACVFSVENFSDQDFKPFGHHKACSRGLQNLLDIWCSLIEFSEYNYFPPICAFPFTAKFNAAPDLVQRALCGYWDHWFSHRPEATSPQAWAALQTYTSGVTCCCGGDHDLWSAWPKTLGEKWQPRSQGTNSGKPTAFRLKLPVLLFRILPNLFIFRNKIVPVNEAKAIFCYNYGPESSSTLEKGDALPASEIHRVTALLWGCTEEEGSQSPCEVMVLRYFLAQLCPAQADWGGKESDQVGTGLSCCFSWDQLCSW